MFAKTKHFLIKMRDILITDIRYLLPCLIHWFYCLKIKRELRPIRLHNHLGHRGTLYQHGTWELDQRDAQAILILHGDYSHPFVMLHFGKMAQRAQTGPVFSLYVSYDEANCESHRALIKQAVDHIATLLGDKISGIVMVGHSMGAIEAAYTAFVDNDKRISSVISIAGRLKASTNSRCSASLKPTIDKIYAGICSQPDRPLYQIVGGKDWNASLESTLVRKDKHDFHIVEDAMHFNIIFHREMRAKFPEFLHRACKSPTRETETAL